MAMRGQVILLIVAAITVVLQIVVAPILSVFSAVPSFIVAFVMVLACLRNPDTSYVYAFVMGLIADLLAQTPLGLTPLLLLICAFAISRVFEALDRSSVVMVLIAFALLCFVFELAFMVVLLMTGYEGGILELFLYRALPSTVLEGVLCVAYYFIMRRFSLAQPTNDAWRVADNVRFR